MDSLFLHRDICLMMQCASVLRSFARLHRSSQDLKAADLNILSLAPFNGSIYFISWRIKNRFSPIALSPGFKSKLGLA